MNSTSIKNINRAHLSSTEPQSSVSTATPSSSAAASRRDQSGGPGALATHSARKAAASLRKASRSNDLNKVKRLIISGANPDLLSDKGHNALYNVAANIKGEPAETLTQTLLDSGADPMVKSKHSGHTALSAAVRHGNLGMVEKLLEHEDAGQLLTAVSGHGQTPLQLAQELQKMAREEEKRTGISYGEVAADLQREKASPLDEIVRRLETAESRRREAAGDI